MLYLLDDEGGDQPTTPQPDEGGGDGGDAGGGEGGDAGGDAA